MCNIRNQIITKRKRESSYQRSMIEEFYSDKSRIIFSSSFRRLMKKAQVFSLETNPSVRNRLTHTLEVADVGSLIALKVSEELIKKNLIDSEIKDCIVKIVECACLMHDIGNPPFGHFGETAIKNWFKRYKEQGRNKQILEYLKNSEFEKMYNDFIEFDGNSQGFRVVTVLHTDNEDKYSLNLTYSTLLASIKYPRYEQKKPEDNCKKLGVFYCDKEIYNSILERINYKTPARYFLSYLMELADDICYCLSDISDAIEKEIIGKDEFIREFRKTCKKDKIEIAKELPKKIKNSYNLEFAIKLTKLITEEASNYFVENIDSFLNGTATELAKKINSGKYLDVIKKIARKKIYTDPEAHRIEIAGNTIVTGLLDHFSILLNMKREDFQFFVDKDETKSGLDLEWRIYKQLSKRMVRAYRNSVNKKTDDCTEWAFRAHLIIDFIAGMTDRNALDVYQNIKGISL